MSIRKRGTLMPWRASRVFVLEPNLPPGLLPLARIARNLCWSWLPGGRELFESIDPAAWHASGQNPVRLLQVVPRTRWDELAESQPFIRRLDEFAARFDAYLRGPHRELPHIGPTTPIAYFSLEFAVAECLPIYAGGLGVLAGDHIKSASDIALPLVAVGLFYREGYFQQALTADGWQEEGYPRQDPSLLPMQPAAGPDGRPVEVPVPLPDGDVICRVWQVDVGRVPLYLLDTDHPANRPEHRAITARLYGGDQSTRIMQETVIGVGGVRALAALGLAPAVFHMNEGHSALLGVERARALARERDLSFEEARLAVAASTVFTTHTAVEAGIDIFPVELIQRSAAPIYEDLGLTADSFADLGQERLGTSENTFSMAILGLGLTAHRNGVSQVHGRVARRLWHSTWPTVPEEQVPIGAINNGVHLPTWVAPAMGALYDRYLGDGWRQAPTDPASWTAVDDIPDRELWNARTTLRRRLSQRGQQALTGTAERTATPGRLPALDPNALTIGFARRFAAYKRATLLFRDPARLAELLGDPDRPVQLVFSGKAHPKDDPGKHLIREINAFCRMPEFRGRVFFLEQYGVELARALVQGCDVWLNTPLRPLEASGTSGMKAVANGGLHLSVLDGWWADAYQPGLGWVIGSERTPADRATEDAQESSALYDLLEREVVPLFYDRDVDGLPGAWLSRVRGSIAAYAPRFNTHRMIDDYVERSYRPASEDWTRLRENDFAVTRDAAAWLRRVREGWPSVRVVGVADSIGERAAAQAPFVVTVEVHCGALQPEDLRVDVTFGEAFESGEFAASDLTRASLDGVGGPTARFVAQVTPGRSGRIGYAVRVTPFHPRLASPLDTGMVCWA